MPTFRVEGASKETGEDVAYDVDAANEADARQAVADQMMVSNVVRIVTPVVSSSPATPQQPLAYGSPQRSSRAVGVPAYAFLQTVSGVITALGVLTIVGGVILFGLAVYAAATYRYGAQDMSISFAALGLGAVINGIVVAGVGQAMQALRDMAVNSFHIRNSVSR